MKQFYFAPLEGITTYIYRNLHHQKFDGMDKYFTPFVSPTSNHDFKSRAKKDVIPEHNQGIPVGPQICKKTQLPYNSVEAIPHSLNIGPN